MYGKFLVHVWYDIRNDKDDKVRDQNKSEWRLLCVAECGFVSPMYCEVKQTKMSEFGVEKGIMQGTNKENGWLQLKKSWLTNGFQKLMLKAQMKRPVFAMSILWTPRYIILQI